MGAADVDAQSAEELAKRQVDLDRFVEAQAGNGPGATYDVALQEMREGQKQECWVWYILPQFIDPDRAHSVNNQKYQIQSRAEAVAFLKHEVLGQRYVEILQVIGDALVSKNSSDLMGWKVDAKKLHHSATTFHRAALQAEMSEASEVIRHVLDMLLKQPYMKGQELEDPVMVKSWEGCPA
eukprot:TRINITY_DN8034_c0_g1_i2.p1 TRINITY_DN8034_c0_g1~~TRINITY_DN8034_c0_g1_i2.p1  ORF type:complete len:181 (-),score=29.17 TRINITY_DN8034_c0_g1_i2:379-921(-)